MATLYWHRTGADLATWEGKYDTFEEARSRLTTIETGISRQYVAVIECNCKVNRFLVSKGCGDLEVIPMGEDDHRWTAQKEMVSEIVNFVMGNHELPLVPGEPDDVYSDEEAEEPPKTQLMQMAEALGDPVQLQAAKDWEAGKLSYFEMRSLMG